MDTSDSASSVPSTMEKLAGIMNDYPVVWSIYALLIFLPMTAIIYFFFAPKRLDATAHRKKTDEPTPDDKVRPADNVEEERKDEKMIKETESQEDPKQEVEVKEINNETTSNGSSITHQKITSEEVESMNSGKENDPGNETVESISNVEKDTVDSKSHDSSISESESHDISRDGECVTEPELHKSHGNRTGDCTIDREGEIPLIELVNEETVPDQNGESVLTEEPRETVAEKDEAKSEPTSEEQEAFQNGYHDDIPHGDRVNGDNPEENGEPEGREGRWSFPPVIEEFDLMDTETDPSELEAIFADERLNEIYLDVTSDGPGLGISIVGGQGSPSGDLPIIVKRVLPGSLAESDGQLKSGDELVAANDILLVGVSKDIAINALSNLEGRVRILVLQDY